MNKQLKLAIEKFNNLEFFECHDILEDYWFECRPDEKDFYQGLLHYAVAFHHLLNKKNPYGAKMQFAKCIERLGSYGNIYKGIEISEIIDKSKKNIALLNNNTAGEIKPVKIIVK